MNREDSPARLQSAIYRETHDARRPIEKLMPWVLDRENLRLAWQRVSGNSGAHTPGIDGATCLDVQRRLAPWLAELADGLLHGTYRASLPRWVDVPKQLGSSDYRRLGILTIRDRVVHAALKQVLEPVLEPAFSANSFGFRPGRSVPAALAAATGRMSHAVGQSAPYAYAVHLDIAACFDNIDHQRLQQCLSMHVGDADLLALIQRLLAAGGRTVQRWWRRRTCGIVQGSALSPLLCNLYLDAIDEAIDLLAAASHGAVYGFRYADDLLILARDRPLAQRGVAAVRDAAGQLGLRLRDRRSNPVRLEQGIGWLGVIVRRRGYCWSDLVTYGYDVPGEKVQKLLDTLNEMTVPPSERLGADAFNLARWIVSINEQLRQWREAYVFADNASAVFQAVDAHARRRVGQLIFQVSGLRGQKLYDAYRARLPRGFWTWQVDGVRLVNLSSLAPRNPYRLVRKPPWQQLSKASG